MPSGAVRYALLAVADTPCICHCRMCQKQTGNYFGAFAGIEEKHFEVTRGEVAYSAVLTLAIAASAVIVAHRWFTDTVRCRGAVTLGSLDDPSRLKPIVQYGVESRMPWFSELAKLPATEADDLRPVRASAEVTASTRITIPYWPPQK